MLMRDLLEEGLLLFNMGNFYDAHEVWEDLWRETADPVLKTCYQGLIQAAVGLHHLGRRNSIGARSQLGKSIRNLQAGSLAPAANVDIHGLILQLTSLLERLESMPGEVPRELRIARLK
jgi:predicted metal-dependent hydrolase